VQGLWSIGSQFNARTNLRFGENSGLRKHEPCHLGGLELKKRKHLNGWGEERQIGWGYQGEPAYRVYRKRLMVRTLKRGVFARGRKGTKISRKHPRANIGQPWNEKVWLSPTHPTRKPHLNPSTLPPPRPPNPTPGKRSIWGKFVRGGIEFLFFTRLIGAFRRGPLPC